MVRFGGHFLDFSETKKRSPLQRKRMRGRESLLLDLISDANYFER
jgi:hypothetical protein